MQFVHIEPCSAASLLDEPQTCAAASCPFPLNGADNKLIALKWPHSPYQRFPRDEGPYKQFANQNHCLISLMEPPSVVTQVID